MKGENMATEKQLQANRANARKSTGPRSMDGKSMASKNSLKHGLLSKEILLQNEDPAEFQALSYQLCQYLEPIGRLEEELLNMIVADLWRLRRINRMEASILTINIFLEKAKRAEDRASSFENDFLPSFAGISNKREYDKAQKEAEEATKKATSDSTLIGGAFLQDATNYNGILKLSSYGTAIQRNLFRTLQQFDQLQGRRSRTPGSAPGTLDIEMSRSQPPAIIETTKD